MKKRSFLIEGFPFCFGNYKPDFYSGKLIDGLSAEEIQINKSVDIMGGVVNYSDLEVELIDHTGDLVNTIMFFPENEPFQVSTNPVINTTATVTLDKIQHQTKRALRIQNLITLPTKFKTDKFHFFLRFKISATTASILKLFKIYKDASNYYEVYCLPATTRYIYSKLVIGGVTTYHYTTLSFTVGTWEDLEIRFLSSTERISLGSSSHSQARSHTPFEGPIQIGDTVQAADIGFFAGFNDTVTDTEAAALKEAQRFPEPLTVRDFLIYPENTDGKTLVDRSGAGNSGNFSGAASSSLVSRDLFAGDRLYFPRNTFLVENSSGYDVTLSGVDYSCIDPSPFNLYVKNFVNDYNVLCSADRPISFENRLCAYYENNELKYLGYLQNFASTGKSWKFQIQHILTLLKGKHSYDYIRIPVDHDTSGNWAIGVFDLKYYVDGVYQHYHHTEYNDHFATIPQLDPGNTNTKIGGFGVLVSPADEVNYYDSAAEEGTKKAFFTGDNFVQDQYQSNLFRSYENSLLKPYGLLINGGLVVDTKIENLDFVDNAFIKIDSETAAQIRSVSGAQLTFENPFKLDFSAFYINGAITSDAPISLEVLPLINGKNIVEIVYQILSSTGTGTNGDYDDSSAFAGMGIPSDLIDTAVKKSLYHDQNIYFDLSKGNIDEELQISGLFLDFQNGKFTVKYLPIPIEANAIDTITDLDLASTAQPSLNFGYYSTFNQLSLKIQNMEINVQLAIDNVFFNKDLKVKKLTSESNLNFSGEDLDIFNLYAIKSLKRFSAYSPVLDLELPGKELEIGDSVTLHLSVVAGKREYRLNGTPAIVIGKSTDYQYKLAINTTDSAFSAIYAPGLKVESYSGASLTLESLTSRYLLSENCPIDAQILTCNGDQLWSGAINAITGTTATAAPAPSYDQDLYSGYLTLQDFTDELTANKNKYAFVCSSGSFSDSTDGKKYT